MKLVCADCQDALAELDTSRAILVTDPPFNIGYHYANYSDNMNPETYFAMLARIVNKFPRGGVVVQYPEALHHLSITLGRAPERVVSWVYNSNTAKQHRDAAFYGVVPDFKKVRQPYKNPNDRRIKERIARGLTGCKLYDWWNVNQVKNVSKVKTEHPCQMPLEVMKRIVGILPEDAVIVDPFMGSGTTGIACQELGRDFVGIEIDAFYYRIALERLGVRGESE